MFAGLLTTQALCRALDRPSKRQTSIVPSYVTAYAPYVWIQSQDPYFPSDIGAQLQHTKPEVNFAAVPGAPSPLTLDNLDALNSQGGTSVYLTSVDDITKKPPWLNGVKPDSSGKTNNAVSTAIIVNDHGSGNVDVFYMYFYAYNYGPPVLDQDVDDHVGDWEHTMVRFLNEEPQAVWFSQHAYGEAFSYNAVEKKGQRPVAYSANGSHANYATAGTHDHTIPNLNLPRGFLEDQCDQGTLWDPTLSAYYYSFDAGSQKFTAYDSSSPTAWLSYNGQWGDQEYPKSDPRQHFILPGVDATAKFTSGPNGPLFKQLNRTNVCIDYNKEPCIIRPDLGP